MDSWDYLYCFASRILPKKKIIEPEWTCTLFFVIALIFSEKVKHTALKLK